jgi:uncharacterized membrane protein
MNRKEIEKTINEMRRILKEDNVSLITMIGISIVFVGLVFQLKFYPEAKI